MGLERGVRHLDRCGHGLGAGCEVDDALVVVVVGVVERERDLEDVFVEVAGVVFTAALQRPDEFEQ